jgi:hypothetical protein
MVYEASRASVYPATPQGPGQVNVIVIITIGEGVLPELE